MCGSPATDFGFRDPGMIHQATLKRFHISDANIVSSPLCMYSLTPGQTYYYIFGDAYGWSSEYTFKAAPYPGSSNPVTIIAYGGLQTSTLSP